MESVVGVAGIFLSLILHMVFACRGILTYGAVIIMFIIRGLTHRQSSVQRCSVCSAPE